MKVSMALVGPGYYWVFNAETMQVEICMYDGNRWWAFGAAECLSSEDTEKMMIIADKIECEISYKTWNA